MAIRAKNGVSMDIKSIFDEAISRGEKFKSEIVNEILSSRTLQDIVGNKNFIRAISTVIQTKDEVKRVISSQVKSIFNVMDVPSKDDLINVAKKISHMEKVIEKIGRSRIAVSILPQLSSKKASPIMRASASSSKSRKSSAKKSSHKTAAKKKS